MKQFNIGDGVIIQSTEDSVVLFSGSIGTIIALLPNVSKALVSLTFIKNDVVTAYKGETLLVSTRDLSLHEKKTEPEEPIMQYSDLQVGDFIMIGASHAQQMDYTAAIACEAIIEYKEESYAHVLIVAGPLAGSTRDIHASDCFVKQEQQTYARKIAAVDLDAKTIFYADVDADSDLVTKVKLQLENTQHRIHWGKHTLPFLVTQYGYPVIDMHDMDLQEDQTETPF